jgi:hypothetical protein
MRVVLFLTFLCCHLIRADAPPIQQWIDEAINAGGGVVTIPEGVHVLSKGLLLKNAKKLALRGISKERCVLKLSPLTYAVCAQDTAAGESELRVHSQRGWVPGMRARIECDGAMDSFTKKPCPYLLTIIEEVKPGMLRLKDALPFPVPATTMIRHQDAPNLIEIREACETLEIANLTLDGGRVDADPQVQGHAQLCAVFATGAYDYVKGPTGPKPKGIVVRDCIIQNCFGRGVALYSVEKAEIERCSFRDGCDEAIDFDHFTRDSSATGNQITRCRIAFELNDANDCVIAGNEARDCGVGVSLWRWCLNPGLNEGHRVQNNSLIAMSGNAVQIGTGTKGNLFEDNDIENPGRHGFSLAGEAQVLKKNRVIGSGLQAIVIQEGDHKIMP